MYLRVDDRLVHGQVVTAWVRELKVRQILVVDDTAAGNRIIGKALKMAAPRGIDLTVASVEEGKGLVAGLGEHAMVIVKYPVTAAEVVGANAGMPWTVNVGNVGSAPGRTTYADTVHLDEANYAAVQALMAQPDVDVFMQTVPGQPVNRF